MSDEVAERLRELADEIESDKQSDRMKNAPSEIPSTVGTYNNREVIDYESCACGGWVVMDERNRIWVISKKSIEGATASAMTSISKLKRALQTLEERHPKVTDT